MTFATKEAPPGGEGTSLGLSSYGGVDLQGNIPSQAPAQAQIERNPRAVRKRGFSYCARRYSRRAASSGFTPKAAKSVPRPVTT